MASNIILLVVNILPPTQKESIQRFMGMICFVRRFVSDVAARDTNLKALVTKNVQWTWHARKGFEKSLHS